MEYVYPPRPKGKITPSQLGQYEATKKWVVQRKFNGDRAPIRITADRQVFFWNRHQTPLRWFNLAQPGPTWRAVTEQVLSLNLNSGSEYWLDGELLRNHSDDPAYKDKFVLYDVLFAGHYLFGGPSYDERYDMLVDICGNPTQREPANEIALVASDNIWLAETWSSDFAKHYREKIDLPVIEGLVLKKPKSVIDNLGTSGYEITWQLRCRKPSKNYEN
jgi:hypothetical protein